LAACTRVATSDVSTAAAALLPVPSFGTTEIGAAAQLAGIVNTSNPSGTQGVLPAAEQERLSNKHDAQVHFDPALNFDDPRLITEASKDTPHGREVREFLTLLSVCHTVIPERVRAAACGGVLVPTALYQRVSPGLAAPRPCCGVSLRAVLCCAVLCCAVLCCAVLCCAVLCCAVPWCGAAGLAHWCVDAASVVT
jgi:hypothetical protein